MTQIQHTITPYSQGVEPFVWWENVFTEDELNWLQKKAKMSEIPAQIGGAGTFAKGSVDTSYRRSNISWLSKDNQTAWLFEKLSHVVSSINCNFYRFDLTGFGENIQLTNYDETDNGMYNWHVDYGSKNGPSRKLSIVLQLTDPSEYEGGNLQVCDGTIHNVRKQRGLVAAFPSYTLHQVTPVTKGSRQSLVAWITGPSFR